jgi:SAM-dependent methyltransferase
MPTQGLPPRQARRFYDWLGRGLDWISWYEAPALGSLVRHGRFSEATAVFELGCGTGRLAHLLLSHHLPREARYVGADVSPRMVSLARRRLAPFGERAQVMETDGSLRFPFREGAFDRFLATYVLDLLPDGGIREVFGEAWRLLVPGGCLVLAAMTHGTTLWERTVTGIWKGLHRIHPFLVGGCRPLDLMAFVERDRWALVHHSVQSTLGFPSQLVVLSRRPAG